MKVIRIKGKVSKKISVEVQKGLWKSWEVGFGAEADLEEGENWKDVSKSLEAELKTLASQSLNFKKMVAQS